MLTGCRRALKKQLLILWLLVPNVAIVSGTSNMILVIIEGPGVLGHMLSLMGSLTIVATVDLRGP